jgi:hypothetical protein
MYNRRIVWPTTHCTPQVPVPSPQRYRRVLPAQLPPALRHAREARHHHRRAEPPVGRAHAELEGLLSLAIATLQVAQNMMARLGAAAALALTLNLSHIHSTCRI